MALEIVTHGITWINELAGEKIKCPECGKKRYTKQVSKIEDATTHLMRVTWTCEICGCVFKLERELSEE